MKGKRTGVEFEKHELIVCSERGLLIHHLKKPDTICGNIKFVNIEGALIVLGDYGHWMFCRQFHPTEDGYVSDGYWLEKCDMEGQEFDPEETQKEIEAGINGGLAEIGYEGNELKQAIEYYKSCLNYLDTEWEYVAFAHGSNKPSFIDHSDVPFVKKTKQWLRIVFDGFDEICRRIKEGNLAFK
jgi:hypothetical protein